MSRYGEIFTAEKMQTIFPLERTNVFFEALFGDAEEGSYDIRLDFVEANDSVLDFEFKLFQRPGKCLVCSLTYGLPQVFSRHPVINVAGITDAVAELVGSDSATWELGATREISNELHLVPLKITLS